MNLDFALGVGTLRISRAALSGGSAPAMSGTLLVGFYSVGPGSVRRRVRSTEYGVLSVNQYNQTPLKSEGRQRGNS